MKKLLTITIAILATVYTQAQTTLPYDIAEITSFDEPWAMAFLPDGRMLVAEKRASSKLLARMVNPFVRYVEFRMLITLVTVV